MLPKVKHKKDVELQLQVQDCKCLKKVIHQDDWDGLENKKDILEAVTCSKETAILRGYHQKVVAYSIFSG